MELVKTKFKSFVQDWHILAVLSISEGAWQNQTSLHTELYLQGLLKYSNYTAKVAGFSNFGIGPYSYPIVCSTLQDGEFVKVEIKLVCLSSRSNVIEFFFWTYFS